MKKISRRTLLVLIAVFFLITLAGQVVLYRTAFTGSATDVEGTAEILIYPQNEEVVNCTYVTTVGNSVIVDNSAQAIAVNSSITTNAAVTSKLYCTVRYNINLQAPNGVAGTTFLRTYYVDGSDKLNNSMNQVTLQLYYQDAWVTAKGQNEATLDIYEWTGAWTAIAGSTLDTVNNYVQGTSTSFGYFGLFAAPAPVAAAGGGVGGEPAGAAEGGGGQGPVAKKSFITKAIEIISPATKVISETAKKVIKYAAPVTKKYWPILALASLLVVGISVWTVRRRRHMKK